MNDALRCDVCITQLIERPLYVLWNKGLSKKMIKELSTISFHMGSIDSKTTNKRETESHD